MRKWITMLVVGMVWVVVGCSATRSDIEPSVPDVGHKKEIPQPYPTLRDRIDPGKCRVVATIVDILQSPASNDASNPCSQTPCKVYLRIDRIIGMGAGFSANIQTDDTLIVQIRMLVSTETAAGPVLRKGAVIRADLDASPVFGGGVTFSIDRYQVESAVKAP